MTVLQPRTGLGFFRTTRVFLELKPTAGETCCICMEPYGTGHRAVRVHFRSCMHTFGRACLNGWLESGSPMSHCCPICRKQWYTPSPDTEGMNSSYVVRLMEALNCMRSRIRRTQPTAVGVHNGADVITGLPFGTTAEEIMEEISQDLDRLESMNLASLGHWPYIHEQLRNLEVRFELLRQNVRDSRMARSSPSQFNVLGLPPRPFDDIVGGDLEINRFSSDRRRDRDFVGFLDQVRGNHSGYQRTPSPPPYEARTGPSANATTTNEPGLTTEISPPGYEEAIGLDQSDDELVQLQAYLNNYSISTTPEGTPNNAASVTSGSANSRGALFDTSPISEGIHRSTRTRMTQIPDTSGVHDMRSRSDSSLHSNGLQNRQSPGHIYAGSSTGYSY